MLKKTLATVLALALLLPAVALGDASALPFGLKMGMTTDETLAAFKADATLSATKPNKEDYDNGAVEFNFDSIAIPGTDITADSFSAQVDENNSAKTAKLTTLSFVVSPTDSSIAEFRTLLAAITKAYGAPESDPFSADAVDTYVEWGTLDATWAMPDARVSLSLSRMYEESITLQYTSRLNSDKADLGL